MKAPIFTSDVAKELPIMIKDASHDGKIYSSFYCTGNMNRPEKLDQRVCLFGNMCYDKKTKEFNYYKPVGTVKRPKLFDPANGLLYDFHYNRFKFVRIGTARAEALHTQNEFSPIIVDGSVPLDKRDENYMSALHVLWKYFDLPNFNLGHTLWEDMASSYISMIVRIRAIVCSGDSASMEGVVWNHFPHLTKLYYQVRNESDYVWDIPNIRDTRNYASVVVKMPRLKELIETALENSAFETL
ncbi:unnamed protein product [Didymodactylos carnosus]|uniref:Uncharacterized protein n=1 Tax=Didymodactylos carnosus TaxID=1234261 RepID=A0A8S2T690_9BILA|nr:unnamed protein product [Didymodactylos carnosus]CAF4272064.1 unnamed protein product [Didymodactylos carnosus]